MSSKAFLLCWSPQQRILFSPLCNFIEGFGHNGKVGDPFSRMGQHQELSDLVVGRRDWN